MSRSAAQSDARSGSAWQVAASLLPIGGVLVVMLGGAVLLAVAQSLGFAPWYGINSFPDTRYFADLWGSEGFWLSVGLTLYYSLAATLLALLLNFLHLVLSHCGANEFLLVPCHGPGGWGTVQPAVAVLVFLGTAARANLVSPNFSLPR